MVGTGTDEIGVSGEFAVELDSGVVTTGTSGTVEVSEVEAGGGTHCVQTVDVLVIRTVEIVDVVSREVEVPLVTVLVT